MNSIQKAISLLGGPSKTASALGVTPQAVCFWRDGKRQFPTEHCPRIELLTGGAVRCEGLRPDVEWLRINGKVFRLVDDRCCERDPVEQVA